MPRQKVTRTQCHSAWRECIKNGNQVCAAGNRDYMLNQQQVTRARGRILSKREKTKRRRDKRHEKKSNKSASHTRAIQKHDTKSKTCAESICTEIPTNCWYATCQSLPSHFSDRHTEAVFAFVRMAENPRSC